MATCRRTARARAPSDCSRSRWRYTGRGANIRCNSVHPGFIATPMVDALAAAYPDPKVARERLEQANPQRRIGEVDDVAYLVLYLASDESKFVTGSEFVVDGGATAR